MGRQLAAIAKRIAYDNDINTDITFKKTGEDIAQHIKGVIVDLEKDIGERITQIEAICKVREVSLEEVLEGAEDHEKYTAYEYKMSSSLPTQSKGILEALQKDLNTLRSQSSLVVAGKRQIVNLKRVVDNIDLGATFELSYNELVTFGY